MPGLCSRFLAGMAHLPRVAVHARTVSIIPNSEVAGRPGKFGDPALCSIGGDGHTLPE
jgi:hypothetical protein